MSTLSLYDFTSHLEQVTVRAGYTIEKREGAVLYLPLASEHTLTADLLMWENGELKEYRN